MEELDKYRSRLKDSLKVPEGYFTQNQNALKDIALQEKSGTLVVRLKKVPVWLSAAAVITLGLFVYFNKPVKPTVDFSLNDLSTDTIANYLASELAYGLDDPLLSDALKVNDTPEDAWFEDISNEEIIDFLTDSKLEESTLYQDYED
ncbi:MAG: hypothetical protein CMI36_03515 [Owenweeksia sp.]|nr:hypothetical protein [Owenweeksia sp.]MBF98038.1 hypothetical protein [Owenweeksia sp.]HBF18458.1 hypothetical protein [Cryomorphaceae bacterium]HCQ15833.1 hypothetical protein [Cryomorphaceae bacterium]|tara:strand:+ start:560 stop:1000 length:441 start_codon:yes stop_codon:yes gene_type:complete